MTRTAILTFASLMGFAGSAGEAMAAPPAASSHPQHLIAPSTAKGLAKPAADAVPTSRIGGHRYWPGPRGEIAAANLSATLEPAAAFYVGAVQVYPWREGALYRLYTAPEQVSDITLQAGEALVSVAAGDTARWVIGDTSSGTGTSRRIHVLVKPSALGLRTNLVISTDRRVYRVELESTSRSVMSSIAWSYPDEGLLALKGAPQPQAQPVAPELAIEALDFNYRIEGASVPWRPLRAFDDGRQVFIEFPPSLAQGEAPPLFLRGPDGRPELVNYRVRGRYYVVDRLFQAAELRLGGKQVVRIVRDARPSRRAS